MELSTTVHDWASWNPFVDAVLAVGDGRGWMLDDVGLERLEAVSFRRIETRPTTGPRTIAMARLATERPRYIPRDHRGLTRMHRLLCFEGSSRSQLCGCLQRIPLDVLAHTRLAMAERTGRSVVDSPQKCSSAFVSGYRLERALSYHRLA